MPIYSAISIIRHILKVSSQKKEVNKKGKGFYRFNRTWNIHVYTYAVCLLL